MSTKQGGIKDIQVGRSDIFRLKPDDVHVKPGWNVRDPRDVIHSDHLDQLASSIAVNGVLEPLTVYWEDGKAWLSDGHFRLEATKLAISRGANIESIPVKLEPRGSNEVDRYFSQIVRNSGKNLLPLEQGELFARLIKLGSDENTIAERAGFTRTHVMNMLALREAPAEVTALVKAGKVAAGFAVKTLQKHGDDSSKAVETLTKAVEKAESKGKKKATPKHVEQPDTTEGKPEKLSPRAVVEIVKLAFNDEETEIDNSAEDAPVLIYMPQARFAAVRDALKL